MSPMFMPVSVSNNAGTWAAILVMSPVILFNPAASPLPVETTVILSTFATGLANAPHYLRQAGEQLVNHCGLVVLLISLGFDVHGLGFRFTFLENDLGLCLALRTN